MAPEVHESTVAKEVRDDGVRWLDRFGNARRGQKLLVWSVLSAANYRYIMEYGFADDGTVSFRLGATAHNLYNTLEGIHLHTGCWRFEPVLGDATGLTMQSVSRIMTSGGELSLQNSPIDSESEFQWKPEEFTALRMVSSQKNSHVPASFVSYDLMPQRYGNARSLRTGEEFTRSDLWVTRLGDIPELTFIQLPRYIEPPEALRGAPKVVWHAAALQHSPRDEDFGPSGYDPGSGVALTAWAGFELRPRDLFSQTPLYNHD